ncbi:hypothetical protein EXIGLDRAFT_704208 [Exidia glandulosa HHB12029]|uniref:Uncharacterized protein n=1 Tax=Exidia glandulosa HHB12029 TaxID=1314781 RepID=A0A165BSC7_EXIGL|nr:hypothetical protein EXIGLDRAFT_704208 [Exidia glandulosa HHB12029]
MIIGSDKVPLNGTEPNPGHTSLFNSFQFYVAVTAHETWAILHVVDLLSLASIYACPPIRLARFGLYALHHCQNGIAWDTEKPRAPAGRAAFLLTPWSRVMPANACAISAVRIGIATSMGSLASHCHLAMLAPPPPFAIGSHVRLEVNILLSSRLLRRTRTSSHMSCVRRSLPIPLSKTSPPAHPFDLPLLLLLGHYPYLREADLHTPVHRILWHPGSSSLPGPALLLRQLRSTLFRVDNCLFKEWLMLSSSSIIPQKERHPAPQALCLSYQLNVRQ